MPHATTPSNSSSNEEDNIRIPLAPNASLVPHSYTRRTLTTTPHIMKWVTPFLCLLVHPENTDTQIFRVSISPEDGKRELRQVPGGFDGMNPMEIVCAKEEMEWMWELVAYLKDVKEETGVEVDVTAEFGLEKVVVDEVVYEK